MKKIFTVFLMSIIVFSFNTIANDTNNNSHILMAKNAKKLSAKKVESKLILVKFHADWCGSCKVLGPIFKDLSNKLDGEKILFLELDFTNNSTTHQSKLLGVALGIDKLVTKNDSTGFLLLIDSKTKEVKKKFTKKHSLKDMFKEIKSLL